MNTFGVHGEGSIQCCLDAHGIDGLNQLNELARPHLDLRTFYFGSRSIIYRLSTPKNEDSTYMQLREIQHCRVGNSFTIAYSPIRKGKLCSIKYTADLRSITLAPLNNPHHKGSDELDGYFSKHVFCPILMIFKDVVKALGDISTDFETRELKCYSDWKGVMVRERVIIDNKIELSYKFICPDLEGNDIPAETISFLYKRDN